MIYVLFGSQKVIINRQLKKILNENFPQQDDFNVVKFAIGETPIYDIIYEASLLPLGYEKKAVIINRALFLTNDKDSVLENEDQEIVLQYLKQPNEATDVIFVVDSPKINEKSVYLQAIKAQEHKIFEAKDIAKDDWPRYVEMYFERLGVSITKDARDELIKRIQADALQFTQEANKLALYSKKITLQDVDLLINKPLEENAFQIADFLIKSKKGEAFKVYRDLLGANGEPVRLISLMASQFRLLTQVAHLQKQGLNNLQIAEELGVNDYRVKLASFNLQRISYSKLLTALDDLAKLDFQIKSGEIDRFFGFEMFLMNF